jgi:hypothetical protein
MRMMSAYTHHYMKKHFLKICFLGLAVAQGLLWLHMKPVAGNTKTPTFGFCKNEHSSVKNIPRIVNVSEGVTAEEDTYQTKYWATVHFSPVPLFWINTHDPVHHDIYISGSIHHQRDRPWDHYIWNLFVQILSKERPGQLVVDVGANIGYFSLQAAALGFRVLSFEPMSRNAAKLCDSIVRNHFEDRITLIQNAVTYDAGGRVQLQHTHPTNQGNGKIQSTAFQAEYGVETVTLDSVVHEDVLLMKVDVEGFEGFVLNGARQLLCRHIVKFITIEFSKDTQTNPTCSAAEMFRVLENIGYVISDIVPDAPRLQWSEAAQFPPNLLFRLMDTSQPRNCPEESSRRK